MNKNGIYRYKNNPEWEIQYRYQLGQRATYIKTPASYSQHLGRTFTVSGGCPSSNWELIKPLVEDTDWETDW